MEYRRPPLFAAEDMPRKPLDGVRAPSFGLRGGGKFFPPPLALTASDGGSGAAPPDLGQGASPLGTAGGNPGWGEHWERSDLCEGQSPLGVEGTASLTS